MEKPCQWCGDPVEDRDVCAGCLNTVMEEDEFLREKGIDLSEQITTAFAGSNSN